MLLEYTKEHYEGHYEEYNKVNEEKILEQHKEYYEAYKKKK